MLGVEGNNLTVKSDTVTKAKAKSWTHTMAATSSSNLKIGMQTQISVSRTTHFSWTTLLFQQLCQPTTAAHLVWHHRRRKWGHSVFPNRYTQKKHFAFWAFFFARNPGKVGLEGREFASCHASTASIPKRSWEACTICLTVLGVLQSPKAWCSKAQVYIRDTGVHSSTWKYKSK